MNTYFNIRYEFDKKLVWNRIASQVKAEKSDYICVADGVVLNIANRKPEYLRVINGGMFSICDSGGMSNTVGRRYSKILLVQGNTV